MLFDKYERLWFNAFVQLSGVALYNFLNLRRGGMDTGFHLAVWTFVGVYFLYAGLVQRGSWKWAMPAFFYV
jgi:hypothetical protein